MLLVTSHHGFVTESIGCSAVTPSQRPISSLALRAWDMVRSASLNPPNPLLEEEQVDFERVSPHHLVAAAKETQREYMENLQSLEETLQNGAESIVSAEWLLGELEKLEAPLDYLHNTAALYHNLIQFPDWDCTYQVATILDEKPHEQSHIIMDALIQLDEELQAQDDSSTALAIRNRLNHFRHRGVQHSEEATLNSLLDSLDEIEARFVQYSDMGNRTTTRQKLEDMYAMISIKSQYAKLLGYDNYADYLLKAENRMAESREDITSLHNLVKERFSNTENAPTFIKYEDTQRYLSLDGVLLGMFGLARALFGIFFHEADSPRGWTSDVRLFTAVDESTDEELGQLYLDPFFRGTKVRYYFLSPLSRKSMFLSAPIAPPAWDDQPTPLKFQDALSLVHELGHVMQFMLAKKQPGVATQAMPQDVAEVLPQFLEHFMFEEPILQTLAHVSGSAEPMPSDLIEKLREQRVAEKVHTMNQRAFLGQLELELFSDRDESLVSLQRRLAQEYVPNDLPDKNDLDPLFQVMSDNANNRNMCRYRYLWGECMSADIYSVFKESGVENQDKMRELGMRLRKTMLEPGGLVDGSAFEEFCGRKMSPSSLFAMYR